MNVNTVITNLSWSVHSDDVALFLSHHSFDEVPSHSLLSRCYWCADGFAEDLFDGDLGRRERRGGQVIGLGLETLQEMHGGLTGSADIVL